jgi:hypothetical protein
LGRLGDTSKATALSWINQEIIASEGDAIVITMYLVRRSVFSAQNNMSPIGPAVTKSLASIQSVGIITYAGMVYKKHTMQKTSWKILWNT